MTRDSNYTPLMTDFYGISAFKCYQYLENDCFESSSIIV